MSRTRLALVIAAAALVFAAPLAAVTAPRLTGTVGPSFTISLKKSGKKVTTLKPGRYTFAIFDRSEDHNFHLKGPGVNRNLTEIGFRGSKSVTVTLRAGKYRFYCVPHELDMRGSFSVGS